MKKQINPIVALFFIVISSILLGFGIFLGYSGVTTDPGVQISNPKSYVESFFQGIYRSPELAIPVKKAEQGKSSKPEQTLVTVNNQTDLNSFLEANGLDESDIQKSNALPNTYIVNISKNELNSDNVSLADRKKYTSLYDFSTQDVIYPQWYTTAIRADDIWSETIGSVSTTVAVIDTGFALEHEDLIGRWADGGYDFYNNDSDPSAGTTSVNGSSVSHGTMVAGLVGATGDNGVGVASVNWRTKLLPLQALSDNGSGWTDDVAAAVNYAVIQGADVINLSLGSSGSDPILKEAIDNAVDAGVTVVAAAGNCGANNFAYQGCSHQGEVLYPGAHSNVIAVGATDSSNNRADFSSYGASVDVVAPGYGAIRSTMWTNSNRTSGYNSVLAGTSFASPIVAGVAALKVGQEPSITPDEVRSQLISSANKVNAMGNKFFSNYYGYGLIDTYKLFHQNSCINDVDSPSGDGQQIIAEKHNAKNPTTMWHVQRNNTDSHCEEISRWNANYNQWEHKAVTNVPTLDSDAEKMLFADTNGDGASELIRIKYNDPSGKVVLNFWDDTLQVWARQITTNLSIANMSYGDIQAADTNGNGKDELFFIKYNHTSSGKVMFYRWDSSSYQSWNKKTKSRLGSISRSKGTIIPADFNGDKIDRFIFVQYQGTRSDRVEIRAFSGNLQQWTKTTTTNLKTSSAKNNLVITTDVNGNRKDELNFVKRQSTENKVIIYRWRSDFKQWTEKNVTNLTEF
ncbi:MAG TPA: S8 family serine peptidase [Candidatus Saccharibacteria bacterium]|nr:S8 family serine peptidase [Candidatus Saccharibacteria bacterium]